MSARKFGVSFLLFFLVAPAWLVHFSSPIYAFDSRVYYDWGSYYERVNPRVLGATVFAKDSSPSATSVLSYGRFGYFLGLGSNIGSDSPLRFIKSFQENLALTLTLDPVKKEEVRLAIAGSRLDEVKNLAASGKSRALGAASAAYREALEAVTQKLDGLKDQKPNEAGAVLAKFQEESTKHELVLEEASLRVPEDSKSAVELAISASQKVADKVADLSGKPPLPSGVLERITALKAQGLISEDEAGSLTSVKSRVEARDLVKRFATEGIFPPSDVQKFSELAKEKFFDDYSKIVETKKLQELQRLESDKPDEEVAKKVQEFAKSYKEGNVVPPEIKRYWVPLVRLEELQNTIRPDMVDPTAFSGDAGLTQKYQEVVARSLPRPEDVALVKKYIEKNPSAALDPFYSRVQKMAEKFGASCGGGDAWVSDPQSPAGGYCAPKNGPAGGFKPPEFNDDKACGQTLTPAKGPGGACAVFNNSCLPSGWVKTGSCAGDASEAARVSAAAKTCPSNSHWVSVNFGPEGGYCVPNITYTTITAVVSSEGGKGENELKSAESVCPAKYHRNFPGGPCVPDTYFGPSAGYPTYTPGNFPSPVFAPASCPAGYSWSGTACLGQPSQVAPTSTNAASGPRPEMGGTPSPSDQEAACRAGGGTCVSWTNGACGCERPGSTNTNNSPCPSGQYRGSGGYCVSSSNASGSSGGTSNSCPQGQYVGPGGNCVSSYSAPSSPSRESQEAACRSGGGTCVSWVNGACGCERSSGTPPPSGYGTCPSGQYWTGSSCQSPSYTPPAPSESPEQACLRGTNCSWTGSSCNCSPTPSPAPTPSSEPSPQPAPAPSPEPTPAPAPSPEPTPTPSPSPAETTPPPTGSGT